MMKQYIKDNLKQYPFWFKLIKNIVFLPRTIAGYIVVICFWVIDLLVPKSKNIWVFPVHFFIKTFSDSVRAVFEEVKSDKTIIKIILTRGIEIDIKSNQEDNILVIPMASFKGFVYFLRAKVLFVQHSLWLDFEPMHIFGRLMINIRRKFAVNLWHGIAIKSIMAESTGITNEIINREKKYYIIGASSFNDKLVMIGAFYPVKPKNVIVTGLSRNDFILMSENTLPKYCKLQLEKLRELKGNKKLLVYAPTYRELNLGGRNYEFTDVEIIELKNLLIQNNAILGLRLHYYNRSLSYERLFDNECFFDLDQKYFPDMAMIIRESELIISDYSGLVVDTLYADKPVLSFAYDYDSYSDKQRGFTYPLEAISPFPVCKTFADLRLNMLKVFNDDYAEEKSKYHLIKKLFFEYNDSNNSKRIVEYIKKNI